MTYCPEKLRASIKISAFASLSFAVTIASLPVSGLTQSQIDMFSQNDIIFYDPGGEDCPDYSGSGGTVSGSGYERLKEAVKIYGATAMEMQREYGTPWEVVLAQMQKESGVGTAGIAVSGADNNWLGITGSGDAGSYTSSSGRKWAVYTSVEASIRDWAGPRVLRNGYYDDAFVYLEPNNYDLEAFLRVMISGPVDKPIT